MRGELILPLAVLKQLAPQHNLCGMRDCCARHGLILAPHGKTNVYPQQRQMEPGPGAFASCVPAFKPISGFWCVQFFVVISGCCEDNWPSIPLVKGRSFDQRNCIPSRASSFCRSKS
jgi:hypothetical protein